MEKLKKYFNEVSTKHQSPIRLSKAKQVWRLQVALIVQNIWNDTCGQAVTSINAARNRDIHSLVIGHAIVETEFTIHVS